ncbi:MAG TPA: glucokinase [candidate division Zixibacteria bacterium]|nr:glucokinase [candidate division Zixibacteria bacterium]
MGIVAGYITAKTVELAIVKEQRGQVQLQDRVTFINKDFSDFQSIMAVYISRVGVNIRAMCLGVAGPVIDNEVRTTNIPWHLKGKGLAREFSLERCRLINDLVATARGLFLLDENKFFTINEGVSTRQGNIGLIAAGSGLGQALIMYSGDKYIPFASEGGHSGFTPGNQLEMELWEYIYSQQGYVEAEDVISTSGLERIYRFLIERERAVTPDWFKKASDKVSSVIEHGLAGNDPVAVQTVDMFVDCLATEVANLALKGLTLGGIYLVGLIEPQIITLIDKARFVDRMIRMGKMDQVLAGIPIKVSLDGRTALTGAAAMALTM